jgi:cytochrome d ubiquinol oxidase subunit II
MDVTVIWAAVIALGVFMYVVLDGFDLGIGIVLTFFPERHERDLMTNAITRVRNGNETWLAVGGAALLVALFALFPIGYPERLRALYAPLALMLACLILRGFAIKTGAKAGHACALADRALIGGSAGAAFFQGIALGTFLHGLHADGNVGPASWLAPFSLLSGLGVVATYALLGSCWLVARTEGDLQRRLHRLVWPFTMLLLGFVVLVSVWTPLREAETASRWFDASLFLRLAPVPLLVVLCAYWMHRAVRARRPGTPFHAALSLVTLGYVGLLASLVPYATAHRQALQEAAAPDSSPLFTLAAAAILFAVLVAYTTFGYRVFRGKVCQGCTHL